MALSIEWLLEFIDAFINGDAKEETEEYHCTETTWGVYKAYAFFSIMLWWLSLSEMEIFWTLCSTAKP